MSVQITASFVTKKMQIQPESCKVSIVIDYYIQKKYDGIYT